MASLDWVEYLKDLTAELMIYDPDRSLTVHLPDPDVFGSVLREYYKIGVLYNRRLKITEYGWNTDQGYAERDRKWWPKPMGEWMDTPRSVSLEIIEVVMKDEPSAVGVGKRRICEVLFHNWIFDDYRVSLNRVSHRRDRNKEPEELEATFTAGPPELCMLNATISCSLSELTAGIGRESRDLRPTYQLGKQTLFCPYYDLSWKSSNLKDVRIELIPDSWGPEKIIGPRDYLVASED